MADFPNGLTIFGGIGFDTTNNYGFFLDQEGRLHAKNGRVTESTIELTLTPAQIRTLNSVPVNIVAPANATTFLAPGQCVFVGAQGGGAYSGFVSPALVYAGGSPSCSLDASTNWDGSVPLSVIVDASQRSTFCGGDGIVIDSLFGLALQITSGGDVTGGDAPCTIILTYRAYDLAGLL